jgi:hypothetical protein
LHASHVFAHAELQHTPSTQRPDEHWDDEEHVVPSVFKQDPAPSHTLGLSQVPVSDAPAATFEQMPTLPPTLHAWHVPVHAELQHTPSTHWPDAHWNDEEHVVPSAFRQVPAPSQTCPPLSLHAVPVEAKVVPHTPPAQTATTHFVLGTGQSVAGLEHATTWQTPATQLALAAHTLPQEPQLLVSFERLAHAPLQSLRPVLQQTTLHGVGALGSMVHLALPSF